MNENMYNKKEDTRYSYAGEKAKTANLQKLAEAMSADDRIDLTEKQRREEYPTYNEGVIKRDNFEGRQNNRTMSFSDTLDRRGVQSGEGKGVNFGILQNRGQETDNPGLAERESSYIQGRPEGREIINERSDLADDTALLDEINGFNEPADAPKTEEKKNIYISEEWDETISEFEKSILDGTIILKNYCNVK